MTARRVVQVVRSNAFSGVERYIVDVANELGRRGWEVVVIGGESSRMRAELEQGITFVPARTSSQVARNLMRVRRCDVVHAHMTAAEAPAALLKSSLRAKLVVTHHFASKQAASTLGRVGRRFARARTDVAIAISEFVASTLATPTVVIPNGTNISDLALPRSNTVLLMQRLAAEKDTATGLRAWALSGLGDQDWRLVIHGRGSEEGQLRALASQLEIAESVTFAGFTSSAREVLARSAVLLATAPAEPFGLTVVEAMAEGTAVAAASGGAHPEVLGPDGRFFSPGNAAECAAVLRKLAAEPQTRARLGSRLKDRQRRFFSTSSHVDALEAIYLT